MRIALIGVGKMGTEIAKVVHEHGAVVSARFDLGDRITSDATSQSDVLIDFTSREAFLTNLPMLLSCNKPLVVGTTGWYDKFEDVKKAVGDKSTLLYSSNFSLGVQLFFRMVREAGRLIAPFGFYDVAITETHHTAKLDYPSGTANEIAKEIMQTVQRKKQVATDLKQGEKLQAETLLVSSLRLGGVFGLHQVHIDSDFDYITLSHYAKSRSAFAHGALIAAKWLINQKGKGLFSIDDLINERLNQAKI